MSKCCCCSNKPLASAVPFDRLFDKLGPHERQIIMEQMERLVEGKERYGPWFPGKKNTEQESLEEVMDALNYVASRLAELRAQKEVEYMCNN